MLTKLLNSLPPHWSRGAGSLVVLLASAFSRILAAFADDLGLLHRELSVLTAGGVWLDHWGSMFGLARFSGEVDDDFRVRVIGHLRKPRGTTAAILAEIAPYVSGTPTVTEYAASGGNLIETNFGPYTADDFSYDGKSCVLLVTYQPRAFTGALHIGHGYITSLSTLGSDLDVFKAIVSPSGVSPSNVRILQAAVNRAKLAGTKVILKSQ